MVGWVIVNGKVHDSAINKEEISEICLSGNFSN